MKFKQIVLKKIKKNVANSKLTLKAQLNEKGKVFTVEEDCFKF